MENIQKENDQKTISQEKMDTPVKKRPDIIVPDHINDFQVDYRLGEIKSWIDTGLFFNFHAAKEILEKIPN